LPVCIFVRPRVSLLKVKGNGEVVTVMKAHWGVEVYLHAFLTSALDGGEWSASCPGRFTPRKKEPLVPIGRRLGGLQSRSGRGGEEKNSQPPAGIEP
jgi:hypothetical protein